MSKKSCVRINLDNIYVLFKDSKKENTVLLICKISHSKFKLQSMQNISCIKKTMLDDDEIRIYNADFNYYTQCSYCNIMKCKIIKKNSSFNFSVF